MIFIDVSESWSKGGTGFARGSLHSGESQYPSPSQGDLARVIHPASPPLGQAIRGRKGSV